SRSASPGAKRSAVCCTAPVGNCSAGMASRSTETTSWPAWARPAPTLRPSRPEPPVTKILLMVLSLCGVGPSCLAAAEVAAKAKFADADGEFGIQGLVAGYAD